jgi:hypothetical protein
MDTQNQDGEQDEDREIEEILSTYGQNLSHCRS